MAKKILKIFSAQNGQAAIIIGLTGIQELPENPSSAIQSAIDYAAMQGVTLDSSDITISSTLAVDDTITVTASNPEKQLFFGWVFGRNDTPVGADATALVGMPSEFLGVVPWGVPEAEWAPGGNYTLKYGPRAREVEQLQEIFRLSQ